MSRAESSPSSEILITGFEPFRHYTENSSWEATKLAAERLGGEVRALLLPVDHRRAHDDLRAVLEQAAPRVVLCTGLAEGDCLRIERRARRPAELVAVLGPEVLAGAWPWAEMEASLGGIGLPVVHSENAGEYVCESTYWSLLSFREAAGYPKFAAFLHVPPLSRTVTADVLSTAIQAAVSTASLRRNASP